MYQINFRNYNAGEFSFRGDLPQSVDLESGCAV